MSAVGPTAKWSSPRSRGRVGPSSGRSTVRLSPRAAITGSRVPRRRATRPVHAPAASTTSSAARSPAVVRSRTTRRPLVSRSISSWKGRKDTPADATRAIRASRARTGSRERSSGSSTPPATGPISAGSIASAVAPSTTSTVTPHDASSSAWWRGGVEGPSVAVHVEQAGGLHRVVGRQPAVPHRVAHPAERRHRRRGTGDRSCRTAAGEAGDPPPERRLGRPRHRHRPVPAHQVARRGAQRPGRRQRHDVARHEMAGAGDRAPPVDRPAVDHGHVDITFGELEGGRQADDPGSDHERRFRWACHGCSIECGRGGCEMDDAVFRGACPR